MGSTVKGKKNRVAPISAVVFNGIDLPFVISAQNIINYVLMCVRDISVGKEIRARSSDLRACARELENLCSRGGLDREILRLKNEMVCELEESCQIFGSEQFAHSDSQDIIVSTRCSNIQWLAVCMTEELKGFMGEPDIS
ncbi:MAG: hypothetical protein ACLFVQ_06895 [Chitinispirillaceae bacterium]